jgi:hypothetical protein
MNRYEMAPTALCKPVEHYKPFHLEPTPSLWPNNFDIRHRVSVATCHKEDQRSR